MNHLTTKPTQPRARLATLLLATLVIAGCASAPQSPPGASEVRAKLDQLMADPTLVNLSPMALEEAQTAVRLAEQPVGRDQALGAHRVYMAERKVDVAAARSATRYAESQRETLARERAAARLDARTLEADQARGRADRARDEADATRAMAAGAAEKAAMEAAELQRQIDELKATATERGLVITLGDLLFAFDSAELRSGSTGTLDRLADFLQQYPDRNVAVEGHTDNVGSADYNYRLSERRANAVRAYLVQRGVAPGRIAASGLGQDRPLVSNASESGRQQNRRVELIIANPSVAASAGS